MRLLSARLQARNKVVLAFDENPGTLPLKVFSFAPKVKILAYETLENLVVLLTEDVDITTSHTVFVKGIGNLPLLPDGVFDEFHSDKTLGCTRVDGQYIFRLFAPRAVRVRLHVYESLASEYGDSYDMTRDENGVWELSLHSDLHEQYYCYSVHGSPGAGEIFDSSVTIHDPFSRRVVSKNTWKHETRSIIPRSHDDFDWGDDTPVVLHPRDLIIYEMHVRDMTADPSSGVPPELRGTYSGLQHDSPWGTIQYIKSLGVNAVELLPCHHYSYIEPPFHQMIDGVFNTWNPFERNHWGYMTSSYFAPTSRYATGALTTLGAWNDTQGREIIEFKQLVQAFHREGIAVILDVVYNHTSQYDQQPCKYIDKYYYYHTDAHGVLRSKSGCGNDFNTTRRMSRKLIIDSVLFWMREFHVDGFRFDLATLIDQHTFEEMRDKARALNPHVILIAEPWGGDVYDLERFSDLEFSAWNDTYRDGVKGRHPVKARGYIFGSWGSNPPEAFGKWILGSIQKKSGPFHDAAHSVNYLSCHDGYTLGDFIRLALGNAHEYQPVRKAIRDGILADRELRLNKLAAFMLFVSQGPAMMHAGDEFARSKIIAPCRVPGVIVGMLDPNSYEKDDETNWLNYAHASVNEELVEYYRGLIALRKAHRALRWAEMSAYHFLQADISIASGFIVTAEDWSMLAVLLNANSAEPARYTLPQGRWQVLVDEKNAGTTALYEIEEGSVDVPPSTGCILIHYLE